MSIFRCQRRKRAFVARRLIEDGPRCHYCPTLLDTWTATIDHLVPTSRGGTGIQANLVLACSRCNVTKGSRPHDDYCACGAQRAAESAIAAERAKLAARAPRRRARLKASLGDVLAAKGRGRGRS